MLTAILMTLAVSAAETAPPAAVQDADPPVRVWLNKSGGIDRGDRLRVYVRSERDGYLFVLHADLEGRVRVLFPLDPGDDNFVRGDRQYEVRGRGNRHAFTVYESYGRGAVYAAYSPDPFAFGELVLGDHWDYTLPDWFSPESPEADLTQIVTRTAVSGVFDYDILEYDVGYQVAYADDPYRLSLYASHYAGGFSIGFGAFSYYGYRWYHNPYYYDAFYWDPFYWGPRWRYRSVYYYDPFWYDPYYGGPYRYGPWVTSPRRRYVANPRSYGTRRYTFKSTEDRWGIKPDVIRPRRRYASGSSTDGASASGVGTRRSSPAATTTRRSTSSRVSPSTPTRRGTEANPTGPSPGRIGPPARRSADAANGGASNDDAIRRVAPRTVPTREREPLIDRTPPGMDEGREPSRSPTDRRETLIPGRRTAPTGEAAAPAQPTRRNAPVPAATPRPTDRRAATPSAPRGLTPVDGATSAPRRSATPTVVPRNQTRRTAPTPSARPPSGTTQAVGPRRTPAAPTTRSAPRAPSTRAAQPRRTTPPPQARPSRTPASRAAPSRPVRPSNPPRSAAPPRRASPPPRSSPPARSSPSRSKTRRRGGNN